MGSVVASESSAAARAAWVCLILAWLCFLIPFPGLGLFLGWPLNLVAFILAIVAMSKKGAMAGIFQLVASLIASPVVYFIGLAIFAGSIGALSEAGRLADASASSETAADVGAGDGGFGQSAAAPLLSVDARTLFKDYEANEIAADQKYKGKRLSVTGKVESIDSDLTNAPVVTLSTDGFMGVQVRGLPADAAASLGKGQTLTVECTGAGEVIGAPMLDDCRY